MKLEILQENLNQAVAIVGRLVSTRAQLPVLSNILLKAENNQLKLSATNLETGMNLWVNAKVSQPGAVTIPARVLSEMVASLPPEAVVLESQGDKLTVVGGKYKASVNGIAAEEFPVVPSLVGGAEALKLDRQMLVNAVAAVALSAGTDEARPIFTGIKLELNKTTLRLAATDGYRLSVKSVSGIKAGTKTKTLVVPARALSELARVLSGLKSEGQTVLLSPSEAEKQLILSADNVEIVTRLLEGEFPDFDKIIPTISKTKLKLNREELLAAVRAAAVFAKDSANIVKFKVEDQNLTISANAPQVGDNEVGVNVQKSGENGEIAFNSRYLLELLNVIDAEEIILELAGPLSPGVFKLPADSGFLHLIMPVRVQG